MLPQGFQQLGAQHDVTVLAAFSTLYVNDHSMAVDVTDLQMRQLGSAHSGRVERHQDRAIERSRSTIDQPRDLLRAEYLGQPNDSLRLRSLVGAPGLLQCLAEEQPQGPDSLAD